VNSLNILIIISTLGLIFGLLGTILGLLALVKSIAAEKSTHSVQYMPIDEEIDKENNDYLNQSWATKESAIAKDQDEFRQNLEDDMPDFYPDDDDRKVHSY
jgi:hypothetical protein